MHAPHFECISQQPAQEHATVLNSELGGQGKGLLCFASTCTGDIDVECLFAVPGGELGLLQPQRKKNEHILSLYTVHAYSARE
jgi:hypothetical protein